MKELWRLRKDGVRGVAAKPIEYYGALLSTTNDVIVQLDDYRSFDLRAACPALFAVDSQVAGCRQIPTYFPPFVPMTYYGS